MFNVMGADAAKDALIGVSSAVCTADWFVDAGTIAGDVGRRFSGGDRYGSCC